MALSLEDALKRADHAVAQCGYDPMKIVLPLRTVYLVARLDFEIILGGVVGWLTNIGRHAPETVAALDRIGAQNCAAIVREMLVPFPRGIPAEADADRATQIADLRSTAHSHWRALEERLLEWPDDVDALLREYVAANESAFDYHRDHLMRASDRE